MRYIQIALCIILMIRTGGMIRRKTNVREGRHWIWSMYVETGIIFALAYKEVFYTGIESLILYHICLVYTLVYEIKKTDTLVLKIVWAIGVVVFSCLIAMTLCMLKGYWIEKYNNGCDIGQDIIAGKKESDE